MRQEEAPPFLPVEERHAIREESAPPVYYERTILTRGLPKRHRSGEKGTPTLCLWSSRCQLLQIRENRRKVANRAVPQLTDLHGAGSAIRDDSASVPLVYGPSATRPPRPESPELCNVQSSPA